MASLLTSRRSDPDIVLRATAPTRPDPGPPPDAPDAPRVGWLPTALVGGLLCSLTGWLLVAGLTVLGWVTADPGTLVGALVVGTGIWLVGHGVATDLGGLTLTLVPWGIILVPAVLLSRVTAFAARSARPHERPRALGVAFVATGAYVLPLLVAAVLLGRPGLAPGHLLAVVVVLLAGSLHGATRALGIVWTDAWPAWARSVPRAVLASQLVLLVAGAAVLVTGLVRHLDRVTALHQALDPGLAGGVARVVAQLALAPNAIVWAGSYALGGGFSLGNGSVVAPSGVDLGVVPGLPLLGALPAEGPGPAGALWWLAAGVLAGAVAAWLVVRQRPQARCDETSLVGGTAGLIGGLVFVALAWVTSGDLGTVRLTGLGPVLTPLLVMGASTLGLAGMVTGLLFGLWPRSRGERPDDEVQDEAADTQVIERDRRHEEPTEGLRRPSASTPSEGPRASG